MPTPASPSAIDSAVAARSLGGERQPARVARDVLDAALRGRDLRARVVVGRAQLVAPGGRRDELVQRALVAHAPARDDHDAVAQLLDLGHEVRGQQHRHALVGEAADQQAHVAHAARVQAGGGLVEDQQPRVAQQRAGEPEALAHAVRVAADLVARAVGELDGVERGVDPRGRVAAVERGDELEVPAAGQVGVEARRLDEAGDAVERAHALDERVAAEQLDRCRRRA